MPKKATSDASKSKTKTESKIKTTGDNAKKKPAVLAATISDLPAGPRRLTAQSYGSKRLRRKAERTETRQTKLPNAFKLLISSLRTMAAHWEVFGGILLIYALINLLLIGGVTGGGDLQSTKDSLKDVFSGQFAKISTGLFLFSFLVATGTGTAAGGVGAGAYQAMLLLVISLALVWTFRQVYAKHKVRVRDGFYAGMSSLVQVLLLLGLMGLQLVPMFVGVYLFKSLVLGGIITVFGWQALIGVVAVLSSSLTLYWLCTTLLALYIVTLPEMTPLAALRSASGIVRFRRAAILRKLIFLVVALLVLAAIIMVPITLFATVVAIPVFYVLTVISVGLVHGYIYALYRELIS